MNLTYPGPRPALRANYDLAVCLLVSLAVSLHAALTALGWPLPDWGRYLVQPLALIGLAIVPGYCLAALARLDRYGVAGFAGLALALSLALLAVIGSAVWLIAGAFSAPLLEGVIASLAAVMAIGVLVVQRDSGTATEQGGGGRRSAVRWPALALLVVPAMIALLAFSNALPTPAATRYTEFALLEVQSGSVVVEVTNRESATQHYRVIATRGGQSIESQPIQLNSGQSARATVAIPDGDDADLRVELRRAGDQSPYRSLTYQLPDVR